jgi:hypothetical protein
MQSVPSSSQRRARIGRLIVAALLGGVTTAMAAYLTAAAMPWLFRSDGMFPYLVSELIFKDVTNIAFGSAVLALPISVLLGVPILYAAFRWTTRPITVASLVGGTIGPTLLGGAFVVASHRSGTQPLPYGTTEVLLCVAFLGMVGAMAAAWLLSVSNYVVTKRSAA